MTFEESITGHEKIIEVVGSRLSGALLKIREDGGWVWRMDVKSITYTLHIHWGFFEREEQVELI
jgi:hypothetical protein